MATRKGRRKNPEPESFGAVLPYDQWVDVEKVRVHEDGTMDVIVLDRQLAEAQLEAANPRRRKTKANAKRKNRRNPKLGSEGYSVEGTAKHKLADAKKLARQYSRDPDFGYIAKIEDVATGKTVAVFRRGSQS